MVSFLKFFTIVPHQHVHIIERLGRYNRQLEPGISFLIPFFETVAYKISLREEAINIEKQTAITKDNVSVNMDGVLFVKVYDPYKASYSVERPLEAVRLLANTVMRSEVGKLRLDRLFQERAELNKAIVRNVTAASEVWGINCLRYEILNIEPPEEIKKSMQYEAEAERLKRRDILLSEGKMMSEINVATGQKQAAILNSEGDAETINIITAKEKEALDMIGKAIAEGQSKEVIEYIIYQNYYKNLRNILKKGKVTVAPAGEKSQDLTSLAAIMMMADARKGSPQVFETDHVADKRRERKEVEKEIGATKEDYINLVKKMKYYDNPVLYSTDDEAKKTK